MSERNMHGTKIQTAQEMLDEIEPKVLESLDKLRRMIEERADTANINPEINWANTCLARYMSARCKLRRESLRDLDLYDRRIAGALD